MLFGSPKIPPPPIPWKPTPEEIARELRQIALQYDMSVNPSSEDALISAAKKIENYLKGERNEQHH